MTSRLLPDLHLPLGRGGVESRAVFSPCRRYRYRLVRVWDPSKPRLGWAMLNSSDANEHRNDPTVRRTIGFAQAWGYGGVDIGNLYGLRSKNPADLWDRADPIGPDNDEHLAAVCAENDLTVLAWGANAGPGRAHDVTLLLWRLSIEHHRSLAVLGWTRGGQPRHPLYVPGSTVPETFTAPQACEGFPVWGYHESDDSHWAHLLGCPA